MNGGADPLGVFDDPSYAALAVAELRRVPEGRAVPARGLRRLPAPRPRRRPRRVVSGVRLDRVGRARQRAQPPRLPARRDEAAHPLHRQMLRELNGRQFLLFVETLTGHRQPDARPLLHRRRRPPERARRLPQDPRRLQLAPQAPGSPASQRAALPVRGLGRGVGRGDRVLGPGDDRPGRSGTPRSSIGSSSSPPASTRTTASGCRTRARRA